MAKLILTESQFNSIWENELTQLINESVNNGKGIEGIKQTIKKCLIAGVAITAIISAISKSGLPNREKELLAKLVKGENPVDTIFQKKVDACRNYMAYALKNQNFTLDSTELKPEKLVKAAADSSFDLPFLMAVAHLESCFGATNLAKKTGSVFSQGLWSDGSIHCTFDDPNDSVDGYLALMASHYLIDGKTIYDLMTPGKFVNELGKRYAQDPNYENKIKLIRNRIIKMYPELES